MGSGPLNGTVYGTVWPFQSTFGIRQRAVCGKQTRKSEMMQDNIVGVVANHKNAFVCISFHFDFIPFACLLYYLFTYITILFDICVCIQQTNYKCNKQIVCITIILFFNLFINFFIFNYEFYLRFWSRLLLLFILFVWLCLNIYEGYLGWLVWANFGGYEKKRGR